MPPSIYTVFDIHACLQKRFQQEYPQYPLGPDSTQYYTTVCSWSTRTVWSQHVGKLAVGSFRWFLNRSQYFCEPMFWSICNFCDCQPVADFCKPATSNLLFNRPAPLSADLLLIFATGRNFFCRFSSGDFSGLDKGNCTKVQIVHVRGFLSNQQQILARASKNWPQSLHSFYFFLSYI